MPNTTFYILHSTLNKAITAVALISLLALISGCNKTTAPKSGSLSGRVILVNDTDEPALDPVDFSGVTVALYRLATLDTMIVRINQEYPTIGVQINQETEFDHRLQNPVAVTTTNPDGSFLLSKLPIGTYNLVAMKKGWGYQYKFQVSLAQGENTLYSDSGLRSKLESAITLRPEVNMPSVLNQEITFKNGKHYIFHQDSIILAPVMIETGAVLRVAPGCDLSFISSLNMLMSDDAERFTITSDAFSYTTAAKDSLSCFGKIKLSSPDGYAIAHGKICNIQDGIQTQAGDISFEDMVFSDGGTSIVAGQADITFSNSVVRRFNQISQNYYNNVNVANNVYYDNTHKCMVLFETNATVSNNYFIRNKIGVQPFMGAVVISNNCFDRNYIGVAPCTSDPQILNNNFYTVTYSIELNAYLAQTGTIVYCNPQISGNNFYSKHRHLNRQGKNGLYVHDNFYPYGNILQIQCPSNYWNSMNPIDVVYPDTGYDNLNYMPLRSLPNPNAGIN